ncbi:MAG: hypothetical protein LLG02_07165 [Pelosinus sp.]|nr:hypothetical protein [Pelosinus sp.]
MQQASKQVVLLADSDTFLKKVFTQHVTSSMLSMFGVMASTLANCLITGNVLGATGLAVMSVVTPIYFVFATLGALIGVGSSTLASHAIGQDDQDSANAALTLSVILLAGLSVLVSVVGLTIMHPLLHFLGATDELYPMAAAYSEIYILGGIGTAMFYLPYNFLKLMGRLRFLTGLFLGMAALNVVLDLLFLIQFRMGISGVAWGTVISSVLTAVGGTLCLVRGQGAFHFVGLRGREKDILQLMQLGTPAAMNNIATFLRSLLLNRIVLLTAGSVGLTAFSIVSTVGNLSLTVLSGLSQATAPFVSVFSSERDNVSVRRIEKQAFHFGFILMVTLTTVIIIFSQPLCRLFGVYDEYTLSVTSHAVELFAISLIPSVICYILISYYQSAGFTWIANLMTICRSFVFVILPAYILAPLLGLNGVWISFTTAECAALCVLLIALFTCRKQEKRSNILLLDLNAEMNGSFISFVVKPEINSIVESVEKIAIFCEQNQLGVKQTMLVRLSLEEMMVSIRDHCLLDMPQQTIDVRILVVPDSKKESGFMVILRIRNGGPCFNPIAYYEKHKAKGLINEGDSLGIEMIVKAAESVKYKSTFGVNNLTVIL